ncbi:MAG: hypothetical protein E3J72_03015 [Planctomycetota bacterium]|nr:MAG: hypothetical protein E3J72_03015 [Planctomycetota bacterium]
MRKLVIILAAIVSLSLLAGCTDNPYSEGKALGIKHAEMIIKSGKVDNAVMEADINKYSAKYENNEIAKRAFNKGYMEAMESMMGEMMKGMEEATKKEMMSK